MRLAHKVVEIERRSDRLDELVQRASELAREIAGLAFEQVFELRAALRKRMSCGADVDVSPETRALLNRALDILDVSWLTPSEAERLERTLFGRVL